MYLCRAWHDGNICTRIANNTFCAVGILVFLSLLASLAGVVAAVLFGQVYPRVSRQGWSYHAQAHIYSSTDGYDGGYLYYFLYLLYAYPHCCLVGGLDRLCCRGLRWAKGKGVDDGFIGGSYSNIINASKLLMPSSIASTDGISR